MEDLYPLVNYLSGLSRIKLNDTEKEKIAAQLKDILGAAQKLQELDVTEVLPTTHVLFQWSSRDDLVQESLPVEEALRNAPRCEQTYILIPSLNTNGG